MASVEDLAIRADIVSAGGTTYFQARAALASLSRAASGRRGEPADRARCTRWPHERRPLGRYHFLSWARRGIGASVANADDGGSLAGRASLSVQLSVDGGQGGASATAARTPVPVQMFGPGDVVGIDPRHVIRTEPRDVHRQLRAELSLRHRVRRAGFSVAVHARRAEWRPPAAVARADRAQAGRIHAVHRSRRIRCRRSRSAKIAALHDLSDSWNWAHVQVSGDTPLADAMASCARQRDLAPGLPAPARSRNALHRVPGSGVRDRQAGGLGQDVSGITTADPAWTTQTTVPLSLPFYYQFEFHTSDEGDFESLVRRLTPRVLAAEVGQRPMDVSQPDARHSLGRSAAGARGRAAERQHAADAIGTIPTRRRFRPRPELHQPARGRRRSIRRIRARTTR